MIHTFPSLPTPALGAQRCRNTRNPQKYCWTQQSAARCFTWKNIRKSTRTHSAHLRCCTRDMTSAECTESVFQSICWLSSPVGHYFQMCFSRDRLISEATPIPLNPYAATCLPTRRIVFGNETKASPKQNSKENGYNVVLSTLNLILTPNHDIFVLPLQFPHGNF